MRILPSLTTAALITAISLSLILSTGLPLTAAHAASDNADNSKNVLQANIAHREKSQYQNIEVITGLYFTERPDDTFRCLSFEVAIPEKRILQGCQYDKNPERHALQFSKMLMAPLLFLEPHRINRLLFIGMGIGTTPKTYAALFPNATIDVVELDPKVIQVAETFFGWKEVPPTITTHAKDGRLFVKRQLLNTAEPYDLIVLDAFNSEYIPEHLLTKEFLEEVKQLLAPQGIMATNTFGESGLYPYESATYAAVFGEFYNFLQVEENGRYGNRIIVAQQDGALQPLAALQQRAALYRKRLTERFDVDLDAVIGMAKPQEPVAEDAVVLTDQFSPANLLKDTTAETFNWQTGRAVLLVGLLCVALVVARRYRGKA